MSTPPNYFRLTRGVPHLPAQYSIGRKYLHFIVATGIIVSILGFLLNRAAFSAAAQGSMMYLGDFLGQRLGRLTRSRLSCHQRCPC